MEENSPDENCTIGFIGEITLEEKPSTMNVSVQVLQAATEKPSTSEGDSLEEIRCVETSEERIADAVLSETKLSEEQTRAPEPLTPSEPEISVEEIKPTIISEKPKAPEVKILFKGREKKTRRRSSIGSMITNAFIAPGSEDTMSPLEEPKRPIRPRRSVQVKQIPAPIIPRVIPQQVKPVRYSFDLGERVSVKSCLKTTDKRAFPERGGLAPAPKSLTQRTADKVKNKYRKSASFNETTTPVRRTASKLKFQKTCSIRVITPRPEYNPDKLSMPFSDDENDSLDPNRERLSTTQLQLTPNSQSQLAEIQKSAVVQFNAKMVFGDGEPNPTAPSGEDVVMKTDEPIVGTSETSESKTIERKKKSRRKSLILGAASPLKSPSKIEKARVEEDSEVILLETIPDPPRRSRRSVRLNKEVVNETKEEINIVTQEKEKNNKKKRGHVSDAVPNEPNPKRGRRKSGYLKKNEDGLLEILETDKKESEKQKGTIHSFFAPRKAEEKPITTEEQVKVQKDRRRTRRSSAYFGNAKQTLDEENDDIMIVCDTVSGPSTSTDISPQVETAAETEVAVIASCSSSSSTLSNSKVLNVDMEPTNSPKPQKIASIFTRSPAQPKKVVEIKENEASTSSQSPVPSSPKPASKLFSLFSPKPKPKMDSSETPSEIIISDSPVAPKFKESVDSSRVSIGVKRREHWGDKHPETYEFILKMPTQPSIFEETVIVSNENIFKSRSFDENILSIDNINSDLREVESDDKNLLIWKEEPECTDIETLPNVERGMCMTAVFPPSMDYLVEGAEEEKTIVSWLRKWKRRVRKERERELKKQEKKGKKRKDDDDTDYEDDGGYENPLVLIGPTGVGKTALIRALAKQENMRIISMGPEVDRSGAEIKKQLFEALRSHRVDQQQVRQLTPFFRTIEPSKSSKRPEKVEKELVQSLIVFEHVDVFFDSLDRHGVNGLEDVINDASVPVVFTCENNWPRSILPDNEDKTCLEIRMGRNEHKIQKYAQRLVYSCRNVIISDQTIRELSKSVNHDLQALLRQAYLFSLEPKKPFPLTSRHLISNGFKEDWETPRNALKNEFENERLHELIEMYSEILPDCSIHSLYPNIERSWDSDRRKLASSQSGRSESLQQAYEALNGRYSKRDLAIDVLPLLVPIDRVERKKKARQRRHLHLFKDLKDFKTDGDSLINVVGRWSVN